LNKIDVSIVAPVYQEEEIIEEFHQKLSKVVKDLGLIYEVIYVDDGSGIPTFNVLKKIADSDDHVRVVKLSRNFGKEAALTAGLEFARGNAVVTMDSDLQHPPSLIPALIEQWGKGYDIVYGYKKDIKGEKLSKKLFTRLFYLLMSRMTNRDLDVNITDFKLMSRKAAEGFRKIRESSRFIRGIVSWMGYRSIGIPFTCPERTKGTTKFSPGKMVSLAINGMISFSSAPLRMISIMGVMVSALSLIYLLRVAYFVFFTKDIIPDLLPITSLILFLLGVQMVMIGILGEYIAEIFIESKKRPIYLVDEVYGSEKESL